MAGTRDSLIPDEFCRGSRAGESPPSGLRFAAMMGANQPSQTVNTRLNGSNSPELSRKEREQNRRRTDAVLRLNRSRRRLSRPTPKSRLLGSDAVFDRSTEHGFQHSPSLSRAALQRFELLRRWALFRRRRTRSLLITKCSKPGRATANYWPARSRRRSGCWGECPAW